MHDWFFRHGSGKRLIDWLGIDAWIDSSLAETWQSLADRWNAVSSFFARFRLTGWKRLLNEAISEALTLGAGGLFVALCAGHPGPQRVRREQDQHRQVRGQVPRPQRQRDRPARHPAQRRRAARGDPRSPHQGHARHRGPPLLRALRRRLHRHGARPVRERACQRGGAGRLDAHPAAGQEPVPVVRALDHAQDQGGVPRLPARVALHQARRS